ncbi:MAG: hypothetical protein WD021_03280 [Rhodothermales bacterium]
MQITTFILFIVAAPILFCMLTWVAATVYRLYFPEKPLPLDRQLSIVSRWEPSAPEMPVPIGVREIKEDQRRRRRSRATHYQFANGLSNGVPSDWLEDVKQRRN